MTESPLGCLVIFLTEFAFRGAKELQILSHSVFSQNECNSLQNYRIKNEDLKHLFSNYKCFKYCRYKEKEFVCVGTVYIDILNIYKYYPCSL